MNITSFIERLRGKTFNVHVFFILLFSLAWPNAVYASFDELRVKIEETQSLSCQELFRIPDKEVGQRKLEDIPSLNIMTFNVENLFYSKGRWEHSSAHGFRKIADRRRIVKPSWKIDRIREAIQDVNPDIIVLQEVESFESLQKFASEGVLRGIYQPFLVNGNDERGIQIGFLVKRDLPFIVEFESHKEKSFYDPVEKLTMPVFSRDLPALIFRTRPDKDPFLVVLGHHAKSMRHRPGDFESNILREAQTNAAADIMKTYLDKYGEDTTVTMAGDFNTEVRNSPVIKKALSFAPSVFDLAEKTVEYSERVTHSFHPDRSKQPVYKQVDDVRIAGNYQDQITEAGIYQYKDRKGRIRRLPMTRKERDSQGSDHRAVHFKIKTDKMRKRW